MIGLVLLVLLLTVPVAVGLISPDGIQLITLDQFPGTCGDYIRTIVFHESVLRVGDIEGNLISEFTDAVVPLDIDIPSPCLQLTYVHRRYTDTDGVRQLQVREHVIVVFPVVVERCVQSSVEQS